MRWLLRDKENGRILGISVRIRYEVVTAGHGDELPVTREHGRLTEA